MTGHEAACPAGALTVSLGDEDDFAAVVGIACECRGAGGVDMLIGGALNDRLTGGDGGDVIRANQGADELRGIGGDDTLDGGSGPDTLNGGAGFDTGTLRVAVAGRDCAPGR